MKNNKYVSRFFGVISVITFGIVSGGLALILHPADASFPIESSKASINSNSTILPTTIITPNYQYNVPTLIPERIPVYSIPAYQYVPPTVYYPQATLIPLDYSCYQLGATALCNDGSCSYAAHHQGACSHHEGVNEFYK